METNSNGLGDPLASSEYLSFRISTERGSFAFLDSKRFRKNVRIKDLKWRLEIMTGRTAETMTLYLLDNEHKEICKLGDDESTLDSYPVRDGMVFLVEGPVFQDSDGNAEDRYKLSDEEYYKRKGTLYDFFKTNKVGKYDPDRITKLIKQKQKEEEERRIVAEQDRLKFETIELGARCEVNIPPYPARRGVVAYKGEVHFKPGLWVGVRYDEPVGKNDGSVDGKVYFDAPPKYGGFVKPCYVQTGDFPEFCELDEIEF